MEIARYYGDMKKFTHILIGFLLFIMPVFLQANWQIIGNMPVPRFGMASAVLDGKVYLIGGQSGHQGVSPATNRVTRFDPFNATARWDTTIAPLNHARSYALGVTYKGAIYVFGGRNRPDYINTVERYDPGQNQWTVVDTLPGSREASSGVVIGDSLFLVGHGPAYDNRGLGSVDIYRFSDGEWLVGPQMMRMRTAPVVVALHDEIYVLGGFTNSPSDSVFIYSNGEWRSGPSIPVKVGNFAGARVEDSIVIAGGSLITSEGAPSESAANCYIFRFDQWMEGPSLTYPRAGLSLVNVNELLYVFGGLHNNSSVSEVEEWRMTTVTHAEKDDHALPQSFRVKNYPNPFNPSTTILVSLPALDRPSPLHFRVYDATGRLAAEHRLPYEGAKEYRWELSMNDLPSEPGGGVYFLQVTAGEYTGTRKLIYLP